MTISSRALAALLLSATTITAFAQSRPNILWQLPGTESQLCDVSPNGQYLATCGLYEESAKIWRISDHQFIRTIPLADRDINSISFSPDSQNILAGCDA